MNIHPESVLFNRLPEWIIYHQGMYKYSISYNIEPLVIWTTKPFMTFVSVIQPEWMVEMNLEYEFKINILE